MAGATLGDDGLDALFGTDPSPVMAAVSAPSGTYRRIDGGVEVTGTWKYASGVRHADWVMLTASRSRHHPTERAHRRGPHLRMPSSAPSGT